MLEDDEKAQALASYERQWVKFISWIVQEYPMAEKSKLPN